MNKFVMKIKELGRNLRGTWLTLKFVLYLNSIRAFNNNNPTTILRVAQRFIELAAPTYSDKSFLMGRTLEQSSILFNALADKWFRDKSSNSMEQLLEVLRNEFLGRRNGR